MAEPSAGPTLLLVHGAWHGSWAWDRLREQLDDVPTATVDLPSARPGGGGLAADVEALRDAVARIDGPVVVVAHSYAGLVATEALHDQAPHVARIVYLAAFMLAEGEALGDFVPDATGPPEWWDVQGDRIAPIGPHEVFYHDVPAAEADAAVARLTTQELSSQVARPSVAAWRSIPTTYVVCTDDRALPTALQEVMAPRADRVVRITGSHSPMLARPAELAELLRREALS